MGSTLRENRGQSVGSGNGVGQEMRQKWGQGSKWGQVRSWLLREKDQLKSMTLDAEEFIPAGAGRARQASLPAPRLARWLHAHPSLPQAAETRSGFATNPQALSLDLLLKLTGIDLSRCPCCQKGTMIVVGELPRISSSPQWNSS